MAYTFSRMEKIVAIFIAAALIIVMSLIIVIPTQKGLWRSKAAFTTEFKSANKLKENMNVTLQGLAVGKLIKYRINEENKVEAKVIIYGEYADRVREDSVLVLSAPLFGDGELILYPGTPDARRLGNNAFLPSSDTERGQMLKEKHDLTMKNQGIDVILGNVTQLTKWINDPEGEFKTLLRMLSAPDGKVNLILGDVQALTYKLRHASNLEYFLNDPRARAEITASLKNVQKITENFVEISEKLKDNPIITMKGADDKAKPTTVLTTQPTKKK
ncbi:MAG: MlaD family protein [Spirochaetota bacterium]